MIALQRARAGPPRPNDSASAMDGSDTVEDHRGLPELARRAVVAGPGLETRAQYIGAPEMAMKIVPSIDDGTATSWMPTIVLGPAAI